MNKETDPDILPADLLEISSDTVCRLIALGTEFHAQEAVVIPEEPGNPSGDWGQQMLAAHMDDSTFREFKSIVLDLEPDQQHKLVALLWVGRGDYSLDEWNDAVDYAAECDAGNTAEYLIAHPLLPDYLAEGLATFDIRCNEES